jgi:hypothetical protein
MLVEEKSLDQWKLCILQKYEEMKAGTFHHHVISASFTGKKLWRGMIAATTRHILGGRRQDKTSSSIRPLNCQKILDRHFLNRY